MQPRFITKEKNTPFRPKRVFRDGFTIFELMVTIAIFLLITSAILIKHSRFKSDLLVTNLAYEIALSIREAQLYGINVKGGAANPSFVYAYGVHFSKFPNTPATQFELFVDTNANTVFDSGESEGTVFNMKSGNTIDDLCVTTSGGGEACQKNSLDITFKRPDPEANIRANNSGSPPYKIARISILSPQGVTKRIEVTATGQVSVLPD